MCETVLSSYFWEVRTSANQFITSTCELFMWTPLMELTFGAYLLLEKILAGGICVTQLVKVSDSVFFF